MPTFKREILKSWIFAHVIKVRNALQRVQSTRACKSAHLRGHGTTDKALYGN